MFYCNICFCTFSGPVDSRGDLGSAVSGYSSFLSKEVSKQNLKQMAHFSFAPIPFAPEPPATALADPRSSYCLWHHQFWTVEDNQVVYKGEEVFQTIEEWAQFSQGGRRKRKTKHVKLTRKFRWKSCLTSSTSFKMRFWAKFTGANGLNPHYHNHPNEDYL